jgi:glycosyltransferase involved in cell wall biosynthesis
VHVWLLKDGENLPIQAGARKMRMWMLADRLLARGHSIVWWSSTFSHQRRTLLFDADADVDAGDRLRLRLLHANAYRRNVSWERYRHHRHVARRFRIAARTAARPDVIVSAFPTVELTYEAAKYAERNRIPFIVDVRDLWPDIIVEKSPAVLRPVARLGVRGMACQRRWAFRRASSLVATSERYLSWAAERRGTRVSASDRVFLLGAESSPVAQTSSALVDRIRHTLHGKTTFVFIGSFGRSYELSLLADAARRLWTQGHRQMHFVLAGVGEGFDAIRAVTKDLPNVSLPGWMNQDELDQLLREAHVGLVPCISVSGTIPNKVFDYLSAGLPLISSLEGEMEGIIHTNDIGLSYRCGDVDGFCRAAIHLGSNPALRRRQAAQAQMMYAVYYKADAIYGAYAKHVEDVACPRQ